MVQYQKPAAAATAYGGTSATPSYGAARSQAASYGQQAGSVGSYGAKPAGAAAAPYVAKVCLTDIHAVYVMYSHQSVLHHRLTVHKVSSSLSGLMCRHWTTASPAMRLSFCKIVDRDSDHLINPFMRVTD